MTTYDRETQRVVTARGVVTATVDGRWMVLANGFQWGGTYDASGAGDATFATVDEAQEAWALTGHVEPLDVDWRSVKEGRFLKSADLATLAQELLSRAKKGN